MLSHLSLRAVVRAVALALIVSTVPSEAQAAEEAAVCNQDCSGCMCLWSAGASIQHQCVREDSSFCRSCCLSPGETCHEYPSENGLGNHSDVDGPCPS